MLDILVSWQLYLVMVALFFACLVLVLLLVFTWLFSEERKMTGEEKPWESTELKDR